MRPTILVAALALILVPALAQSQMRPQPRQQQIPATPPSNGEVTERLIMTPPQGWQIHGSAANQNSITKQLFPPGQSPERPEEQLCGADRITGRAHAGKGGTLAATDFCKR